MGVYLFIMKIRLKREIGILGKGIVDVNPSLAQGLIRRGQAEPVKDETKGIDDMAVKELQDVAKEKDIPYAGLKKKELKEAIQTKEEKTEYKTK
jgi:hypothetical protein